MQEIYKPKRYHSSDSSIRLFSQVLPQDGGCYAFSQHIAEWCSKFVTIHLQIHCKSERSKSPKSEVSQKHRNVLVSVESRKSAQKDTRTLVLEKLLFIPAPH